MGYDHDGAKAARMLQLLRLLYHNRPLRIGRPARELGVTPRAVYRYLAEMEGPPLYIPLVETVQGWSLLAGWRF